MDKQQDLACVSGLKGFGACMIAFVWHYQHFAPQAGFPFYCLLRPFYDMGDRMVEVFFMLSGFGMILGYERRIRDGKVTFREYIGKRVKKLFPLMWVTLFVTLFLQCIYFYKVGTTFVYPNLDVYHFLLNLFGLQNGILENQWSYNSPSWYIAVLLCCYVALYFIINKFKANDDYLVFAYVVTALAGGVIILMEINFPLFNFLMGRGFACFFVGALLAKVFQLKNLLHEQRIGYLSLIFLIGIGILISVFGYEILGNLQMTVILGIAPTLILSVLFVPWISKLLSLKPFVYLGKISLSIYLWHFPVQCVWKIVDVYWGLEINYSSRLIWLSYVATVLLLSVLYEKFFAEKVQAINKLFVRK
ncbi:MAG: acyltransferase [Lachnospiraceae bacterium]|nr:acyltransferase [Lachnospiraceae bacterium]